MRRGSFLLSVPLTVAVVLALTGCWSSTNPNGVLSTASAAQSGTPAAVAAPQQSPFGFSDATGVATALVASIRGAHRYVTITEKNDPNALIGRSSGYVSAAVVYDVRSKCVGGLGVECGATVEEWPTPADAKARSEYIVGLLKKDPALGSEYDTIEGHYLIRVAGTLTPSQAQQYRTAIQKFGAESYETHSP